ncbi:MAG: sterol desaturase family protein [Myxococcota bacterium]
MSSERSPASTKEAQPVGSGDGPLTRAFAVAAYPVLLTVAIGGGALLVHAEVPKARVLLASFSFMIVSGLLLEWVLPYSRERDTKPSSAIEVVNSVINVVANSRLFGPLVTLGAMRLAVALTGQSGLMPAEWFGPWWMQAIVAYLLMDLSRYFIHRAQHRIPALWAFHKVHHGVQKMRTFNIQFSHPLDYALRNVLTFGLPVLLGLSEEAIVLSHVMQHAIGIPSHYNVRLRFGVLNTIFATCRIHRWHHALDLKDGGDANFSNGLVIWDRLFGTFHHPNDRQGPDEMGIDEGPARSLLATVARPRGRATAADTGRLGLDRGVSGGLGPEVPGVADGEQSEHALREHWQPSLGFHELAGVGIGEVDPELSAVRDE